MRNQILKIVLLSIISSSVSLAITSQNTVLQGHISQVITGEIDPTALGDRCVINVN